MATIDGVIDDFPASSRLDTSATGTAGYGIYGYRDGVNFVFAITSEADPIGAGTTIWLDTDADRSTGHQIWGFTGGAEYNIEIGTDGVARLYSGAAGETPVGEIEHAYGADGRTIEFRVPATLLGGSDRVRVYADVNDTAFLPSDYTNMDLFVGTEEAPVTAGNKVLDGDVGEWAPGTRLDTATTGTAGYKLYGDLGGGSLQFAITSQDVSIGTGTTIWLDTDADRSTGHQIWGFTGGAEYNVNIGADGRAALYSGGAGGSFVSEIDYRLSADGHVLELAIGQELLGGSDRVRVYADVNDAAFLPSDYANMDLFVGTEEAPVTAGNKVLDGDVGEWAPGTRLDTATTGTAGYKLYGDLGGGSLQFAITSQDVSIGTGTTIWLDTDADRSTGHQIWGFTGGAEYNVNIGADGRAALYSGGAGGSFVSEIDYRLSADGHVLELAIGQELLGGSDRVRVYADVNDTAFLPSDYTNMDLFVGTEPPPPPVVVDGPGLRVGIVYSETTAANFYSETAYGQLFMAAQAQAMQAGIPFGFLTEADLKDATNLSGYDLLVFPGMSHVRAGDLSAIASALQTAQQEYGTGFLAAGNFMTNDETGNAIAGDSYARMKTLLGVTLEGFGQTEGLELQANAGSNPIVAGYGTGETVGTYTNNSYLHFTDVTGTGEVLFDQVVTGTTHDAVIATQVGAGRNVHFATDAIMGNNNILKDAIGWAAADTEPNVELAMTRGSALFFSRNDMDQSAEAWDVIEQSPSIYDKMLPILERAYADHGFVGSYYVNVGANPPDNRTDWSVSNPYYDRLIALESEIGSHSYTHPHDTNELLADTPEILALVERVDPRNPNVVDPSTLTAAEQELLFSSFRFQFETSRLIIEAEMGIPIAGAAVPGMPELVDTTREIIRYYDYLTGGYSGAGAGYPGAFGYLTPNEDQKVYIAPNMSFDFTLVGFKDMSAAESEAVWLAEYADLMSHATRPILVFPWHDYGLTNWNIGEPGDSYTESMFVSVIEAAARDGAEFVTGADLADRIGSFADSSLTATRNGDVLSVTVKSPDAGTFALDVSGEGSIASVAGWYAYDETSVFLPSRGGTFDITLGGDLSDATHMAKLPQRADLISAAGDGSNLSFSFSGRGALDLNLRDQGAETVRITGADGGSVGANAVELLFDTVALHDVAVGYGAAGAVLAAGPGGDILIGGSSGDLIEGGAGRDTFHGGGGSDLFALRSGAGEDIILDFAPGIDDLRLAGLGFESSEDVILSFSDTADGAYLPYDEGGGLLLSGLEKSLLSSSDVDPNFAVA